MQSWHSSRQSADLEAPLVELKAAPPQPGSFSDVEERASSRRQPPEKEQPFEAWCRFMGFTSELLAEYQVHREALKALYLRDTAPSRLGCLAAHWLRPRSLEYAPERFWMALSMRPAWISGALAKKACWDPRDWVWIKGIAIPMINPRGYALKLMMSHLWRGGVAGFKLTLHAILLISLGIQLRKVVDEGPQTIWNTLSQGDSETWKRLIYDATGTSARVFWPLIFAPTIVLALAQMVMQTTRTLSRDRGRLVQLTALLNRQLEQPSRWRSWIRPLLPLDQPSFEMATLADQLTFDGRSSLTPVYRQNAARYLMMAMEETRGFHRLVALRELAGLTIGTHLHNLKHYRLSTSPLKAATPLSHLMVRVMAMQVLESMIRSKPDTKEAWLYREWACYHGWMAGRSTNVARTVSYLAMHVGLTAYFFYGFKVIVEAIQAYLDCPDKTGVSVTGIADWSSDYTQPCFDAYLEFFRKIPGQPIAFLLEIIPKVHFTQKVISLDLSFKEMNATEITTMLQALTDQGVSVVSLDLTGNALATAHDYNTLMPVLAGIRGFKELILIGVGLESEATPEANANGTAALADWLPRVNSLSSITIISQWLGYSSDLGVQALARGIARCTNLEAIRLISPIGWTHQSEGLSQLAASVAQLPQLKRLTLGEFRLYTPQMLAWSQALLQLKELRDLQMWGILNYAAIDVTKTFVRTFAKLQQLETLDLTNSMIGYAIPDFKYAAPVHVTPLLAEAVRALPQLLELRLNNTYLGYNQSWGGLELFEALEARQQPLSVLELADNHFPHNTSLLLNALLNRWQLPTMPVQFRNAHDVALFFDHLPPAQTQLVFEDGPQNDEALSALFKNTAKSSVVSLTLDGFRFEASAHGFEGLANCTQLKKIELGFLLGDLSMGLGDPTSVITLLRALSHLSHLESLTLSTSTMLVDGFYSETTTIARALALALSRMTRLRYLNLSNLGLGVNPRLDLMIMDVLPQLHQLKQLDLSYNFLQYSFVKNGSSENNTSYDSQALVSKLPLFWQLTHLDISQSFIGALPNVTRQIAHFLTTVDRPFFLNASNTRLGKYPDEARALMIAIANNPYVKADLRGAGFGSELWPPAVARLASRTYDPYLKAACSNLQCFGVQPSLPDLSNRTRINFREEQGSIHDPLAVLTPFTMLVSTACLVLALCVGLGWLLGCGRRQRARAHTRPASLAQSHIIRSNTRKTSPLHSSRLRAPIQEARKKVKEQKRDGLDVPDDQVDLQLG